MTAAPSIATPRERPILFSAPMVRAIIDGRKTMTRRIVLSHGHRGQPLIGDHADQIKYWRRGEQDPRRWVACDGLTIGHIYCPYGEPGDRLWVRETWAVGACADSLSPRELHPGTWLHDNGGLWYPANNTAPTHPISPRGKTRVSIHMPGWASRILLEVTSVRVERLQDISEEDAKAEGVTAGRIPACGDHPELIGYVLGHDDGKCLLYPNAREAFAKGWDAINGERAPWASNPFCWVISFRRVEGTHGTP